MEIQGRCSARGSRETPRLCCSQTVGNTNKVTISGKTISACWFYLVRNNYTLLLSKKNKLCGEVCAPVALARAVRYEWGRR